MQEVRYRYIGTKGLVIKKLYVQDKESAWEAVKKACPKVKTFAVDYVKPIENLILQGINSKGFKIQIDCRDSAEAEGWIKDLKLTKTSLKTEDEYLKDFELVSSILDRKGRER